MGILKILGHNAGRGSRTRRPDDRVPCPACFRGMLAHDASLCVGCTTCVYVCSPRAITLEEVGPRAVKWSYFAEQCTFCGRCVEYCPTQALSCQEQPPAVSGDRSQHLVEHTLEYPSCTRCGAPMRPLPVPVLIRLYGEPLTPEVMALRGLCERCRGKVTCERIREGMVGRSEE